LYTKKTGGGGGGGGQGKATIELKWGGGLNHEIRENWGEEKEKKKKKKKKKGCKLSNR